MATAVDGLISGLKTAELIESLLAVERGPQTLLKQKASASSNLITAMQALNTKVASLTTAATAAGKAESWAKTAGTSTATSVTATTSATAQPGSLTFTVDKVAQAQSTLYTLPASYDTEKPTFTITQNGETRTITAASGSTANVLEALNAEGTGVKATTVNVGTAAAPSYMLQLTATETGEDNGFSLAVATGADGTGSTTLVGEDVRAASDAQITIFPGTSAARPITSETNAFSSVLSGVDIVVTKAETDPVTVTVDRDPVAQKALASGIVSNLNLVLSEITSRTQSTTSTADDGGTIVSGGIFSGNATIRTLQQQLQSLGSSPVGGVSPSEVGISISRDGTFAFDEAVFTAALAEDPAKVQAVVTGLGTRLAELGKSASDSIDGTLTLSIKSETAIKDDLGRQIDSWDDRLARRQTNLERTYAALEVSLSNLQSQSSWLASQISSLNAQTSSK
jgi:flagellar hook-associated protein 2